MHTDINRCIVVYGRGLRSYRSCWYPLRLATTRISFQLMIILETGVGPGEDSVISTSGTLRASKGSANTAPVTLGTGSSTMTGTGGSSTPQ